jgi:AAA domain
MSPPDTSRRASCARREGPVCTRRGGLRPLKLIFIYGLPATGKLTVARELSAMTGFKLFHNHLAVDLLLSVFEFGSAPFAELREAIWLSVFEQASRANLPGLIFTFSPEPTVRPGFVDRVVDVAIGGGGEVLFVALTCPIAELKQRIDSPSRLEFGKLTSVALFEELQSAGAFNASHMPKPALSIDTSLCSPINAAAQIAHLIVSDALS